MCILRCLSLSKWWLVSLWIGLGLFAPSLAYGQKLAIHVSLISEKVATRVDPRLLSNLQTYLNNFVSNPTWIKNNYSPESVIAGHMVLTLQNVDNNHFSGTLIVQAQRLVYNTSYYSTLINFKDNDVYFEFNLNQIDDFNEVSFSSTSSPLRMNLPAILKFYINLILGMDADSFGQNRGGNYFNVAFQICNNAATISEISKGWTAFTSNSNRFKLAEEMNSEKLSPLHTAFYQYFRKCMDMLVESKTQAVEGLVGCLKELQKVKKEALYSLHLTLFLSVHKEEIEHTISYINDPKYKRQVVQLLASLY